MECLFSTNCSSNEGSGYGVESNPIPAQLLFKKNIHCAGFHEDLSFDSQNLGLINNPVGSAPSTSSNNLPGYHLSPKPAARTSRSLDPSPLHSPTRRRIEFNPERPRGIPFRLHHRSSPSEASTLLNDNNVNLKSYPLPLPPVNRQTSPPSSNASNVMEGQWQKGELIRRDRFGMVYVATNRVTGALCAMKEVDLDRRCAQCIAQLQQEIKILSQLRHPNIVQNYGREIVYDKLYIYMEHVYPGSIRTYIRKHLGRMTESILRHFTRHILSGLAYLHGHNIIHRGINGTNLLVDSMGIVKFADFGMAKQYLEEPQSVMRLKHSPYWTAPEVLQGILEKQISSNIAFAGDIWSVGCTIIELLTGKPSWGELEEPQAMFKVHNMSPEIPETLCAEGKDFLKYCLRRNPKERPSAYMLLQHPFVRNTHES